MQSHTEQIDKLESEILYTCAQIKALQDANEIREILLAELKRREQLEGALQTTNP